MKKLKPWNWFKDEDQERGKTLPVAHNEEKELPSSMGSPFDQFHQEIDRLFEDMFHGTGFPSSHWSPYTGHKLNDVMLKPRVDVASTDQEYTIKVEVPGVDEKDVKIELHDNTLLIKGEKKLDKEEKDKDFYRVERSYGSFQRMLSLPEDANQEKINASFKDGVLTVSVARKSVKQPTPKQIEITKP